MNLKRISVKLSWMLRHCQTPRYIDLNGGWADVDVIIKALKERYPDFDRKTLELIVAQDEKGRYSFDESGTKIRANQGHSIPGVVIEMDSPEPPEFLYHGTAERFLDAILKEGLKPMTRQFVHISPDYDDAAVRAYLPRLRNRRQGRQKTRQARDTKDPRKRFQERRQRAVPLLKRRMAGKGCTAGIF